MLEQKFKPNKEKLGLTDIVLDISQENPDYMKTHGESLARTPHVYYNGYELNNATISKMTIDFNKFIPTISFNYVDMPGLIHKHKLPIDDTKIKVLIPSNNKVLGNIVLEFKIEVYDMGSKGAANIKEYNIAGVLSVNSLLIREYKTYKDKSSYEVFEEFARESGLGFVSNINSTNDRMTWNNYGQRNLEFLQEVRDHAWIGENNFVWCFIDPYYNLTLVDVEKSLSQDLKDVVWSYDEMFSQETQNGNMVTTGPPVLTTMDNYQSSNIHIFDFKLFNNSTEISLKNGYRRNVHYYDIDGNWKDRAGHYYLYGLDTINSPGSEATNVYTRSDDADFYQKNNRHIYAGLLDTKNVHPDYLWADVQNTENVRELEKFIIQVFMKFQNFNIRRFEKVQIHIYENNKMPNESGANKQLSNDYLCTGFSFEWNGSGMTQIANFVARELPIVD